MEKQILGTLGPEDILNSLADGAYITDTDRRILFWNHGAERITGWPSNEVLGHGCREDVLEHVDKDGRRLCGEEACPLHRAIVTGKPNALPVTVFARNRRGGRVPMQVNAAPIRDAAGEVIGGIETFRDLTPLLNDLERAKAVQRNAMEDRLPQGGPMTFRALYAPVDFVGGDFYRIEEIEGDRYAVMIADVMGHGTASALFTMHLRSLWENFRPLLPDPAGFLTAVNAELCALTRKDDHFATAVYCVFDPRARTVSTAGAGHQPPLLFHPDGRIGEIPVSGLPLGFADDTSYREEKTEISPGDAVFLYTDGAVEVFDDAQNPLGVNGFKQIMTALGYPDPSVPLPRIEEELIRFSGGVRLDDDVTLLEMRLGESF